MAEVAPGYEGACAQFRSAFQHGRRRRRLADHQRCAGAQDASLLRADGLARVAEILLMIQVDAGNDGNIRIDYVHGVQTGRPSPLREPRTRGRALAML